MTSATTALTTPQALEMLAGCFMEPAEKLLPDRARGDIAGWDSMGALLLIAELDERFGIELSADASRGMKSVADALSFLRLNGALAD